MNTMDLGSLDSGVMNYPCTMEAAEVSELWSFDINTFVWEQLNATNLPINSPGPREQHSAIAVDNEIYLFGGKSRRRILNTVSTSSFTSIDNDITKNDPYRVQDVVLDDLWKLVLDKEVERNFSCPAVPTPLSQTSRVLLTVNPPPSSYYPTKPNFTYATASGVDGNISPFVDNPRQGYCIQDVTVSVRFEMMYNRIRIELIRLISLIFAGYVQSFMSCPSSNVSSGPWPTIGFFQLLCLGKRLKYSTIECRSYEYSFDR